MEKNNQDLYFEATKRNHFWVGGPTGQQKILNLKVGVAGLGGMGSNIAEIFARLGVGLLRITDPDTIDRSNLNRQVIANESTIGMKKAVASYEEISRISKHTRIEYSTDGIQKENVKDFVAGLDVVINEIDVFHIDKQLYLLNEARKNNICVYTTLVVGLGIHLYKYDPTSNFTPEDFLGTILENKTAKNLVARLGGPLPAYLQDKTLEQFIGQISEGNVPIFGASTYLGQSLLAIRVLHDLNLISVHNKTPKTPCLPQFLVLDPLTLEFKIAELLKNGDFIIHDK